MKNFVKKGDTLTYTATGVITSGKFVALEDRAAMAVEAAVEGDSIELLCEGVVTYTKAAVAINQGAKLYYHSGNDNVTTSSSSAKACGWAAETKASGDTSIKIKLGAF